MNFYFTMNPNLKLKKNGGIWGREGGARVSEFFTKHPNLKKKKKKKKKKTFLGGRAGRGRSTDRRTGRNQFAPSTSLKLWAQQRINVQVMALTSSICDHFII